VDDHITNESARPAISHSVKAVIPVTARSPERSWDRRRGTQFVELQGKEKKEEEWLRGSDAKDPSVLGGGGRALGTATQHVGQPKADQSTMPRL